MSFALPKDIAASGPSKLLVFKEYNTWFMGKRENNLKFNTSALKNQYRMETTQGAEGFERKG